MSFMFDALGDQVRAYDHADRALKIARGMPDNLQVYHLPFALQAKATASFKMKQHARSLEMHREALTHIEKIFGKNHPNYARALCG